MSSVLFAGVDWGGSFHQLCVLDAQGRLLVQQRIIHDVAGLGLLADRLSGFGVEVLVAIERAEGLLVEFLQTRPEVTLFCLSPKISARARERYRLYGVEAGHLRRVRAGRHVAPRAPPVAAFECAVGVDRAAAGGVAGSATGAAREGGV